MENKDTEQTLSTETLDALRNLKKAFNDLARATEATDTGDFTEWDELASEYPFEHSFDELCTAVTLWVDAHLETNGVAR